ncbi:phytanoyl-CoA dioxygenase family protein [Novosphingobium sp.]|uniref:phytanoyl-CoA dioxygenase family protein n=1 Tax=Novosphingobium sp. TaxID=1874826 RepID=UPI003BA93CFF
MEDVNVVPDVAPAPEQYKFDNADEMTRVWRYLAQPMVEPGRALPVPTRDLAALIADYDTHGYCLVANAADPELVTALKTRIVEQFAGELAVGRALQNPYGDERITNLLAKGDVFQRIFLQPLIDDVVEHALGDSFIISTVASVRTKPRSLAQGLHIDQSYVGIPTPMALVCNAVWLLDDFTDANGATRIIPGSHRWSPEKIAQMHEGLAPSGGDGLADPAGTIAAEAPAGTCMIFDGRLLHGTGRNKTTDQTRSAVFAYYCRPFVRQFENPFLSIPDDKMMSFSPELRQQIGYRPWTMVGGCEAPGMPAPLDVVRPLQHLGALQG